MVDHNFFLDSAHRKIVRFPQPAGKSVRCLKGVLSPADGILFQSGHPSSSVAFMYKALGSTHLFSMFATVGPAFLSAIRLNQNAIMVVYLDQHVATGGMRLLH
jgi:hypothetical protein